MASRTYTCEHCHSIVCGTSSWGCYTTGKSANCLQLIRSCSQRDDFCTSYALRTSCRESPRLLYGSNSTWLDSTHSTCRAHAFWLCRASRRAQLDTLDTSSSTGATCNLVMITVIHLLISYSLIN